MLERIQIRARYVLALAIIHCLFALATFAQSEEGIRQIDFKNFSYWLDDQFDASFTGKIRVKKGLYEEPHKNLAAFLYFKIEGVIYGDLTGDGIEEAVVVAKYGSASANFFRTNTYVYTLAQGHPKLLGIITERRIQKDYDRFCDKCGEPIYEAISGGRKISDHILTVEHFAGGGHVYPAYVVSLRYRWIGNGFALVKNFGKRRKTVKDQMLGFQKEK